MRFLKTLMGLVGLWLLAAYAFGPLDSAPPPQGLSEANRPAMPAEGWPDACMDHTATRIEDAMKPRIDTRDTIECRRALAAAPRR